MLEFFLAAVFVLAAYQVYASIYFKSKKFNSIKDSIAQFTLNCNALNEHIEDLKSSYSDIKSVDYGIGHLSDDSRYNMRRRRWAEEEKNYRTHNCSSSVCKNASSQPFKYLCKYFNIKPNEATLTAFEEVLNNFSAAEQGKLLLKNERDVIVLRISKSISPLIFLLSKKRLIKKLGFNDIDLSDLYFPIYTFQYVSAGGNSSLRFDLKLDINNLDGFVVYLSELVKFRKSIVGQRALMTSRLREKVKNRDGFSCKICGLSVADEKNLLLEIDHIIPLSKGGITSEENLQTLCWKCNRSKGSKILLDVKPYSSSYELPENGTHTANVNRN
jgi:hypothetical protein